MPIGPSFRLKGYMNSRVPLASFFGADSQALASKNYADSWLLASFFDIANDHLEGREYFRICIRVLTNLHNISTRKFVCGVGRDEAIQRYLEHTKSVSDRDKAERNLVD